MGEVPRDLEVEVAVVGKEDARLDDDDSNVESDRRAGNLPAAAVPPGTWGAESRFLPGGVWQALE